MICIFFGINDSMFVCLDVCIVCVCVRIQMSNMFLSWLRLRPNDGRPTLGLSGLDCLTPSYERT